MAIPMVKAGPLLWDAKMLWQSPWQPRYTARVNKADRRETEKKEKKRRKTRKRRRKRKQPQVMKTGAGWSNGVGKYRGKDKEESCLQATWGQPSAR